MVSFVLMCSCVVIKLCQFLQNLRNHTFPFISYIASQFRKISLPSLVDVFSDVFLAISLSALQGNFRRNALPSVLRALLYIAGEFRKICLPSIDDVLSELWLAIRLLTRTIQCHWATYQHRAADKNLLLAQWQLVINKIAHEIPELHFTWQTRFHKRSRIPWTRTPWTETQTCPTKRNAKWHWIKIK